MISLSLIWVYGFSRKILQKSSSFSSPHITVHINILIGNVNSDHFVKVVFTSFLNCEVIFLYSALWKLVNNSSLYSKGRGKYIYILLRILYEKSISSPPFIYSVIYINMGSCIFILYFRL